MEWGYFSYFEKKMQVKIMLRILMASEQAFSFPFIFLLSVTVN